MSIYLIIVIFGFLFKCEAAFRTLENLAEEFMHLRVELIIFFVVMILLSVLQIPVFAPPSMLQSINVDSEIAMRCYYTIDGMSTAAAGYLLLSMFSVTWHKHWSIVTIVLSYTVLGAYQILFTDILIAGMDNVNGMNLARIGSNQWLINSARYVAFLPLILVSISLFVSLRRASSGQSQVRNILALSAFAFYDINYILNLFAAIPILISLRGIIFFFVVVIILHRSEVFDFRLHLWMTFEQNSAKRLKQLFLRYTQQGIDHKRGLTEVQRLLFDYKIKKLDGADLTNPAVLEALAQSMKISRATLLDLLHKYPEKG